VPQLAPRLRQLALLVAAGKQIKEIAYLMHLTWNSANCYRQRLYRKAGVHNGAELVAWLYRNNMLPTVSLIVSCHNRPDALGCCLYSLKRQTMAYFEVLVADNSEENEMAQRNERIVRSLADERFSYHLVRAPDCYAAVEFLMPKCTGEWVGFPSEDNIYAPAYLELLLKSPADLLYCDMIYDPRYNGEWSKIDVKPKLGHIDKGGFLMRRRLFKKFPSDRRLADGLLVNELMRARVSNEKAPGVLWIHC
jgi:DNA-binding CsgD family transcriptional regulator/glycosyltransferase involved in cell wall biosynthesis